MALREAQRLLNRPRSLSFIFVDVTNPDAAEGMRATLERTAMMAYAAEASGAPTPTLRMTAMVNADAALLDRVRAADKPAAP